MQKIDTMRITGSKTRRLAAWALAAALLAGCATGPRTLRTDVTSFNDWSALPASRIYVFSRTLEYRNSLEVKAYEELVRSELAARGFREAPEEAQAALVVTLRPTETSSRFRVGDSWGDPFWGGYGYGYGYGGFGGYGGFYGRGGYWPGGPGWYGGYGSYGGFSGGDVEIHQSRLELDIDARGGAGRRYYEGRVETSGGRGSLPALMPALVRALFSDFPGNNGETKRVDVPVPAGTPAANAGTTAAPTGGSIPGATPRGSVGSP